MFKYLWIIMLSAFLAIYIWSKKQAALEVVAFILLFAIFIASVCTFFGGGIW